MRILKAIVITIILAACSLSGFSQSSGTGFEILITGPSSKALGYNEATTAVLLGASNIYSNPANLAFEASSAFNADYALWIGDLTNTHLAVNFKRDNSAIGFGLLASEASDFELRTRPGPSEGSFSVSYLSLSGAYAFSIRNFSIGATLQYLREELYIYNASGYALNAGLSSHWFEKRLYLSAALQNLGEMDNLNNERTLLPALFRVGLNAKAFQFTPKDVNFPIAVSLLTDIVFPLNGQESSNDSFASPEDLYLNMGLSIKVADIITVRSGYKTGDSARPLSFGTGIAFNNIAVDYALVPFETGFGTVHSIGIGYSF